MTENDQVLCYVAVHRECGLPIAVCVDEPEHAKDNAEFIAPFISEATMRVDKWTVKTVRKSKWCKCRKESR